MLRGRKEVSDHHGSIERKNSLGQAILLDRHTQIHRKVKHYFARIPGERLLQAGYIPEVRYTNTDCWKTVVPREAVSTSVREQKMDHKSPQQPRKE